MSSKLSEAQERERASWQYRAILATRGNQSMMGCMLQAIVGIAASNPPTMGLTALISEDGFLFTNFVDRHGRLHAAAPEAAFPPLCIGEIKAVVGEVRELADRLNFSDADREALFDAFRKWVAVDMRAIAEPLVL